MVLKGTSSSPHEIVEAVEVFLTLDGNPPSSPYFRREWEIANDGNVRILVCWNVRTQKGDM